MVNSGRKWKAKGSGGALTTCRHGNGDPREDGPRSHHPSKLEGSNCKGPERNGAEGDSGCRGIEQTIAMKQQGSWIRWESVRGRSLSWKEIWNMEGHRIKFLLRAVYDVLPTNLHRWRLTNLEHILSSCRAGLTEGRFRWRHDQVLAQLANGLERERKWKRTKSQDKGPRFIGFLRPGEKATKENRFSGILGTAVDWEIRIDLGRQLKFPEVIAVTSL